MSRVTLPPLPTPAQATPREARAAKVARDFEGQFLKSMLEQAFAGLSGEGPLGGAGHGMEAWRSMLIDEHARGMSARGGIGIAAGVYRQIMTMTGAAHAPA
jgi:Rod binding domain-containing protein